MYAWLFVDLNSYFASVEQQERPELRGKPVAVVPMLADSTSCIAASYEAKKFGIKAGTRVSDAKRDCPNIVFVVGRHELYIKYHEAIVAAVESCLPVSAVMSVDEMACRLTGSDRLPENALQLAQQVKKAILNVGSHLTSSVGLASNRYLSKVAADMQKPDGLSTLSLSDLPHKLYSLELRDFPGIGRQMEPRIRMYGITTAKQLLQTESETLKQIWGGINGERMYRWLKGEDFQIDHNSHKSLSHSHVLAPDLRNMQSAHGVAMKLLNKVSVRLRKINSWTSCFELSVRMIDGAHFQEKIKTIECQDTFTLMEALDKLWRRIPQRSLPIKVSLALLNLIHETEHNLSFFEKPERLRLSKAMDAINQKYGKETIYFAGTHLSKSAAPTRISFQSIPDFEV